jgi:DNA-binding CsgD family transcriptional regulator
VISTDPHHPDGLQNEKSLLMENDTLLNHLIGQLYDAGLEAISWESALDQVMQAVDAEVSALLVEDRSRRPTGLDILSLRGYPDDVPSRYGSYFVDHDIRQPAIDNLSAGQLYVDNRTMPFSVIEQSEIYNDFYRPIGVAHGMGAVAFNDGKRFGILSVHRALKAGEFRPKDILLFERIAPHLTRALHVQRQVARANAVADGLAVALRHFQMAVLLVDERGEVIEFNPAAGALLRQPVCPLRLTARRLSAVSSGDAAALAHAIAAAIATAQGRAVSAPPILRLAKTDGSGVAGVMVVPARPVGRLGIASRPLVLVFVSDPRRGIVTTPELLTSQFGLSPTEAQVAARLAAGDRIEEIADTRRVSQETVRVQVKRILAKTETRSQGQLIAVVARSFAVLRRHKDE